MRGHLFILRGDLTRLWCDAWLVPSGRSLRVEDYWMEPLSHLPRAHSRLQVEAPEGWREDEARSFPLPPGRPGVPRPWLTNVGYERKTGHPRMERIPWFVEGVRAFLEGYLREPTPRVTERPLPLLGVPLVGTGRGGGYHLQGDLVRAHLESLLELVRESPVDVVLTIYSADAFAAAQEARKLLAPAWDLAPEHVALAERLARDAEALDLVLFLGAGVSRGAGLPDWQGLLEDLMAAAGMGEEERRAARALSVLDQARLVERRLGPLSEHLAERLDVPYHSLAHGLLAGLPVRESVTTNYDRLFEHASRGAGHSVAVLPYAPVGGCSRWLLKLHGCVLHPEDIVLTRQDYMRYSNNRAALAGIVQTLLLTKHMLFVGFSLSDDNFLRIVDDVRRALHGERSAFATALLLTCDPIMRELWEGELELVSMGSSDEPLAEVGRRLDIFLDYLLARSTSHQAYLLREYFEGLLSSGERELREALLAMDARLSPAARSVGAYQALDRLLRSLGLSRG